jgi:hypothetical protein
MRLPGLANVHLSYCLNVHPGRTLAEAEVAVFGRAKRVFDELSRRIAVSGPFGLGMWFSAEAARELGEPGRLADFRQRLDEAGFYAFTFNGFPYGRFHGTRVKERVYQPDWSDSARYDYTDRLAGLLANLLPEGVNGTISTLPVMFKSWATEEKVALAVRNLADIAALLDELREDCGREIVLALEPEPGCYLERTDDAVRFFEDQLLVRGRERMAEEHGYTKEEAEEALRGHIGVCLDTTHCGVMFEEPTEAVGRLRSHGIRIGKVQLGAALSVAVGPDGPPRELRAFSDEVYLHQVAVRTPDGIRHFLDLPEALAQGRTLAGEWRVHFHVPLAWGGEGPIATTSGQVSRDFLAAAVRAGVEHFESEIYTLDVFPALRGSAESVLAQDIAWLHERLTSP